MDVKRLDEREKESVVTHSDAVLKRWHRISKDGARSSFQDSLVFCRITK
jgi:hypothetical protein